MRTTLTAVAAVAFTAPCIQTSHALTQRYSSEYGYEFSTIRSAGNRGTIASETPSLPVAHFPMGQVDYNYRLSRTEVTSIDLVDFLNAYGPYMSKDNSNIAGVGTIIFNGYVGPDRVPTFRLVDESQARLPGQTTWELWARYANWLHNDKAITQDAFESGVYDMSLLGTETPITRSKDARFWIPSQDEWIKGMYYDPDRYGEGEEGYWMHPDGSNTPLIPGLPESGGETNAGSGGEIPVLFDVGSYPDTQSPWGLLDGSGGAAEWLDTQSIFFPDNPEWRMAHGSSAGTLAWESFDRIDFLRQGFQSFGAFGLRLGASVPSPGHAAFTFLFMFVAGERRRS